MAFTFHRDGTLPTQGEVFVFGSNLAGRHGKGAALVARLHFGATLGVGSGRVGQSYAIATKDRQLRIRSLDAIHAEIADFKRYAAQCPLERFFVTRVGCVLAGYSDAEIAPLFRCASMNCSFAVEWQPFLCD